MLRYQVMLFIIVLSTESAFADKFDEALQAYNAKDYEVARQLALETIDAGDLHAHSILGDLYWNSFVPNASTAQALSHYNRGHEAGNSYSRFQLGWIYYNGQKIPRDYDKAREYFAADVNSGGINKRQSALFLAWLTERGQGGPQDTAEAFRLMSMAGDLHSSQPEYLGTWELGYYYLIGYGVGVDQSKADVLFDVAIENGNPTRITWTIDQRLTELLSDFPNDLTICPIVHKLSTHLDRLKSEVKNTTAVEVCADWVSSETSGTGSAALKMAQHYLNGNLGKEDLEQGLYYARRALALNATGAESVINDIMIRDFVYGHDNSEFNELEHKVRDECVRDPECAFSAVWDYLDRSEDNQISLAELSRFQRVVVKLAMVDKAEGRPALDEITAATGASVLVAPLISTAIVNSFDYNADGFLQPVEVVGDSQFSDLIGVNVQTLEEGFDLEGMQRKLQKNFGKGLLPLLR